MRIHAIKRNKGKLARRLSQRLVEPAGDGCLGEQRRLPPSIVEQEQTALKIFDQTKGKGVVMNCMNRRSVLSFAVAAAAANTTLLLPGTALAGRYPPEQGVQMAPGVRRVDLSKKGSEIPGYSTIVAEDIVFQPGSKFSNPAMSNDMVCQCVEGELVIDQGMGMPFTAKTDDVWSCRKGMPETTVNHGKTVAIMRVIILQKPA